MEKDGYTHVPYIYMCVCDMHIGKDKRGKDQRRNGGGETERRWDRDKTRESKRGQRLKGRQRQIDISANPHEYVLLGKQGLNQYFV